jgi:RNA polymerase sigma factor (sigma-70 family)
VSPLSLRRYRAERLLRQQFETLHDRVLSVVRRRLRARGVSLDDADLDACYAQAWQGLFMVTLEGREISNAAGWLVTVTFRRAIEEHRAHARLGRPWFQGDGDPDRGVAAGRERDLAAELDDRARLRQLFEALRGRLSAREREAAVLCYLQGLPRSQAASKMAVSEARMRKLMDGRGAGRPGVAREVGRFLKTIREGGWCEEQASLMRGLAFGLLDPEGDRYRLALIHGRECPACRAYVVSLRGLAAALPPTLMGPGLAAAMLGLAEGGGRAGAGLAGASANGTAVGAGPSAAAGASANGAAVGAAPGVGGVSSLLSGPLGAKLAASGLLALGLGAGGLVLATGPGRGGVRTPLHAKRRPLGLSGGGNAGYRTASGAGPSRRAAAESTARRSASPVTSSRPSAASREFGPERRRALGGARSERVLSARTPSARAASSRSTSPARAASSPALSELEFAPG